METQCTCCGFFWLGKKRDHAKSPIVKRVSKEHLLSYNSSEDSIDKAKAQYKAAGRQAAKAPLNQYRPPKTEPDSNGHVESKALSFEELRASMRQAAKLPLVLPLLKGGVKETSHEFRSQVFTHLSSFHRQFWAPLKPMVIWSVSECQNCDVQVPRAQ